ncbi:MAG TPA: bifunctional phosphoribosylaminoimidazolecarboxamide formyltransferase/IMP cyclohydrolase [Bdellovibrionota bacterium]|jgi:phosphoribosylaminoimidazolecarboxamide formyltransferase/IMP cyclohydrolase
MVKIRRALFSVSDKEGAVSFARFLHQRKVEILGTGGTLKKLEEAGIPVTPMEKITGNPEAFGGRMKTISFPFASALLYRRDNPDDVATAKKMGVEPVDLVVCNLYPFQEAKKRNAPDPELVEEIDVGGPTMIRAAAKNHAHVAVATCPSQYAKLMAEIENNDGALTLETRKSLAVAAFQLLSSYDGAIAAELGSRYLGQENIFLSLDHGKKLRYGENPHQGAVFYRDPQFSGKASIASADILQGKALSYNNLLDADAALRSASDAWHAVKKERPAVSIIKHLNPCGLATGKSALEALELAWEGDPVSAFGGILCFTTPVTKECADWLGDKFVELVVAPSVEGEALAVFAKKKNLRVLLCPPREPDLQERMIRSVLGGVLVQDEDEGLDEDFKSVTKKAFPKERLALASFGVMAAKHLRSNAIALVKAHKNGNFQLVGAGMGQPNRIDSLQALAGPRAKTKGDLEDLVLVSDAFFPFADGIEAAGKLGIKFVVQPGGSIRDEEVVAAADRLGMAMVFTGRRHFRH